MASVVQQPAVGVAQPSADVVGNAFVHQYYHILHQSPEHVHRFYQDVSKLGRPEGNGMMGTTTTMHAINEKILSLDYGDLSAAITTVDAQDSHNGGVLVLVTGYLTGKDNMIRKFTQSFFLAPQDKGYFVLNDVFRYVDEKYEIGNMSISQVEAPLAAEQVPENIESQEMTPAEEVSGVDACNSLDNGDVLIDEEVPVPEVLTEVPDELQMIPESGFKNLDVPKKSYASILKVLKQNNAPSPSPAPAHSPMRSPANNNDPPASVAPPAIAQPQLAEPDAQISASNVNEDGNDQDVDAEGLSIYVKGLPLNATHSMLENEFKKFGIIGTGGIQVRCQKGFCFGFVEFEASSAAQSAIEASPVIIGGRKVVVEEKRSTRGNNRGRPSSFAGPGFRNEAGRGHGYYGGNRGYGRGEFSDRGEGYRNGRRGGFTNRGGDGYQRGDRPGSSGGGYQRGDRPGSSGGGYQRGDRPGSSGGGYQRGDRPGSSGGGYQRGARPGSSGGRVNRAGKPGIDTAATRNAAPQISAPA